MTPTDSVVLATQTAVLFLPVAVLFWILLSFVMNGAIHMAKVFRDKGKGIKNKNDGTSDLNAIETQFERDVLFENPIRTRRIRENSTNGEMWYSTSTLPSESIRLRHSWGSNSSVNGSTEITKQNSSLPANNCDSIRMDATCGCENSCEQLTSGQSLSPFHQRQQTTKTG